MPIEMWSPHVYSECARIWNPIHTERRVALAAGLDDIIVHGTATWAIAAREVAQRHADGDLGALRRLAGTFRAVIVPGSQIRVQSAPDQGAGAFRFKVLNEANEAAVAAGLIEFGGPQ